MNPIIAERVRRAVLDLLEVIGGEHNDEELAMLLNQLGHRIARRHVAEVIRWLADAELVTCEELGSYVATRILPDGRDVANGVLTIDGVSRHKTGE